MSEENEHSDESNDESNDESTETPEQQVAALRQQLNDANRENAARRKREKDQERELAELRESKMDERERELEQARREAREAALAEARQETVRFQVEAAAAKTLRDPDDARLLPIAELAELDGDDRQTAIDSALAKLVETKPHLARDASASTEVGVRSPGVRSRLENGASAKTDDGSAWLRRAAHRS